MSRDRTERGWHSDSTAGPKDESRDSPFHGRQAQTRHHSASKGGASGDEDDIKTPDRGDTGHKSSEYETFQPPRAEEEGESSRPRRGTVKSITMSGTITDLTEDQALALPRMELRSQHPSTHVLMSPVLQAPL
ncbi:hypothetical protein NQZ68_007145, partial [Dissostichus eleginoides]